MYTVIITGSRHYQPSWRITDTLNSLKAAYDGDLFVKVGDCSSGVDKFTFSWCWSHHTDDKYRIFKADWNKHLKAAGPIRNHEMVDSGGDLCIAWPLEDSRGTKDCAEYAESKGIPVWFPDLPGWSSWAAPINQYRD